MKIQIDNIVRDMTPEELAEYEEWKRTIPTPVSGDDATIEDYENSLADLGVRFGD